ncbi:kinase-like protein [Cadophora sp. DSE1049]|nr:kinase-like protein [Cadophora sp. DSE1049]
MQLFKLTKKESDSDEKENGEALLIRIYGGSSGTLVDRGWELDCHTILFEHGLAPRIIGRFKNGYAYGFVPGKVCSPSDLADEPVWRGVARRMAEWHATLPLEYPPRQNMWKVLEKWISALPTSTEEGKKKVDQLRFEGGLMQSMFCKTYVHGMPELVFTHCDLLAGNIVIRPKGDQGGSPEAVEQVDFIDFEYAMAAPAAFDIASHFSEWAGFECDYTLLPSRSLRRRFLTEYTSTYNNLRNPENDTIDLDEMCAEVDKFRGVPGYVWGLAALVQAQVSKSDFDFNSYADLRIQEYLDYKAEKFGTREKDGKKMPLRERCWARDN